MPNDVVTKFLDEVGILAQTNADFIPQLVAKLAHAKPNDLVDISEIVFAAKAVARHRGKEILDAALHPDIVIPDPSGRGPPLVIPQNEVDKFLGDFFVRNMVAAGSLTVAGGISGLPADDQGGVIIGAMMEFAFVATAARSVTLARLGSSGSPVPKFAGAPKKPPLPSPMANPRYKWSGHRTAAISEEQLARTVHNLPDEVVVRWGDKIGAHGGDVISVNMRTGKVTLWDSKFRGSSVRIRQSPTFSDPVRRQNAVTEALNTIRGNTSLPDIIRQNAIRDLQRGVVQTRTVGAGSTKNSVLK